MNFEELNLRPSILRALKDLGYKNPSPVQEKAIPVVLRGRDLIGCAQTGTGKTCAFAVPIIQNLLNGADGLDKSRVIRALVLTPTRELALQIFNNFRSYAKYNRIRSCVVFGGVGYKPQIVALGRGTDVLIATPGRLNDLVKKGYVDLSKIKIFVLDEADRMLDMGFINDVKHAIKLMPKNRQTLLFSATMPKSILSLANFILKNPVKIVVSPPSTTVESIDQCICMVEKQFKTKLLIDLLKSFCVKSTLVFTKTKAEADLIAKELSFEKISAKSIHGDKTQWERQSVLNGFKNGDIRVLVATDIAARGIDIDDISCVINYDLPENAQTYVHRIGRTGRAGKNGKAISFCETIEIPLLRDIEKAIKKRIKTFSTKYYIKRSSAGVSRGLKQVSDLNKKLGLNAKTSNYKTYDGKKQNFLNKLNNYNSYNSISGRFSANTKKAKSFEDWVNNNRGGVMQKRDDNMANKSTIKRNNSNHQKDQIFDFARRRTNNAN